MLILLTTTLACSTNPDRVPLFETVDVELEVSRFLATDDALEEEQILQRLNRSQVSHNTIKALLSQKTNCRFSLRHVTRNFSLETLASMLTFIIPLSRRRRSNPAPSPAS